MGRGVAVLAVATFAIGTQTFVFAGLLAALAADLGVSVAVAGQLAAAFALTFALSAPFVAQALGARDRRRVVAAGLVAVGLLNLAAAVAPRFEALLAIRVACGAAAAAVVPMATAAAAQLAPPELRGRALATVLAGTTIAFVLGIPTGSFIGGALGWRASFAYAGLLSLAAAAAVAAVLPPVPPPGGARPPLRSALVPGVLRPVALTLLSFVATFTTAAYVGPLVALAAGVEGGRVGLFQSLIGVGAFGGVALGGRLADRAGARRTAAVALFAAMTLTLSTYSLLVARGAGASGNAPLLAAVLALGAGALFALSPIVQATVVDAAGLAGPVALAINGSAVFLGQGLGAALGGLVIGAAGYASLGLAAGAVAAAGALVAWRSLPAPAPQETAR